MTTDSGERDARVREFIKPVRIVWQSPGKGAFSAVETLLDEDGPECLIRYAKGAEAPGIVLDYGRELHGGIQLWNGITAPQAPTRVRVRFGESVAEVMGEPNQDHAVHDQIILVPWYGHAEFGNTGFRFVRLDLVDPGSEIKLRKARAVFLYRDLPYRGAFRCNDARLDSIWQTGAYTVHLCMQDMLWDGIKRDRLVWIGDIHPETSTICHVFGNIDVVPISLDFVRDETPLPGWMNGISSYSLWWIRTHHTWYRFHGDKAYLEQQRGYLGGLLDQLVGLVGPGGREQLPDARFLDWPSSEDPATIHAGLHALLHLALNEGAELCAVLGDAARAAQCRDTAQRMRAYTPPATRSKQGNALIALSGLGDPAAINRGVLAVEPLRGVSTFYGYYVLQARAAAGDHEGAIEVIRTYWGKMLELGATTFWEDFDLEWAKDGVPIDQIVPPGRKSIHAGYGNYCYKGLRHSLCHGWASGPTAWMSEHILGCTPLEPGCAKVRVAPNLAGLEWAEGRFPTPHGDIALRHERRNGRIESAIEAPPGVEIVRG